MEKSIILANEISEITKLNAFIEEIGNEFSLTPDRAYRRKERPDFGKETPLIFNYSKMA